MAEAYCGPAPTPVDAVLAWNPDPVAISLCAGLAGAHLIARRGRRLPLALGIGVLATLFLSPLCALSVALFSARALHHALLIAAAAPFLALAFPARPGSTHMPLGWLTVLHAAVLWLWHVPAIYEAAIGPATLYWTMQASLLGTGFLLWRRILAQDSGAGRALLALLATVVQMGMLGALLTFARAPLYEAHLLTTIPFGLSPLEDQQLAGLVMWVPAALPYLAAALLLLSAKLAVPARSRGAAGPWSG